MKTILSFFIACSFAFAGYGQGLSVDDLFTGISFSSARFENQLSGNGFAFTGKDVQNDTVLRMYDYRRTKNFEDIDSISRSVTRADTKNETFITYETASLTECANMKAALKKTGFYCTQEAAVGTPPFLLYQNKDRCVRISTKTVDTASRYLLEFHKKKFPRTKDINYANDLLTFTSHEYLAYYFGEKNVKKDNYFLSGNEIAKCSVLFFNTNRQVVFIWADEENRCTISSLLFGGQLNLKSSLESGKYVEENDWVLKSGLRAGMSLLELRMRNGSDFSFYGGNSANSGLVIPDNNGKIDFKKEEIILGCLNCRDDKFNNAKVINADESIEEGRILFVLSVILNPS